MQAKSVLNVSGYLISTLLLKGRDYSGIQETTSFGKQLYYAWSQSQPKIKAMTQY